MRVLGFVLPLALVGSTAGGALAEEPPIAPAQPAGSRRASVALEPSVGLGAPLGYLGASVVVSPLRVLALHGGAGLGQQGPQVEAGLRYRAAIGKNVYLTPGLSWSTGSYATTASDERQGGSASHIFYWDRAHFVNTTLAVEAVSGGIAARPFVGFGYAFGNEISANQICPASGCRAELADRVLLFAGFALGFDLF